MKRIALVAALLTTAAQATVTGNPPPSAYTCNGVTTTYTISFPYLAQADLVVTRNTAGVVTTLVLGTDYTVTPAIAPSVGTLKLTSGGVCPNGSTLTISRNVPLLQPQTFRTGAYNGPATEQAIDRLAMQNQQISALTQTNRANINSLQGSVAGLTTAANITASTIRGRDLALDYVSKVKSLGLRTDKPVAITRKDANTLLAYRPLGGPFWMETELKNTGSGCSVSCPYSWDQTRIIQIMSYTALALNGSLVYTGVWAQFDSGDSTLYIGGHAKQSQTATDHVDLTFSGGGDLYVIWVGRTNGTFVKVAIDGSDANANALPVGGTGNYHFIDTYRSPDLQYKQTTKVATGLPSGSHTITLTVMADHNAANVSGVTTFLFNGIGLVGKDQGLPTQTNTRTPQWVTGATYVTDDWVTNAGKFYFAVAGGVAGATPPTCSTGTCSDGTITWTFAAASSYDLNSHIIQLAGSQVEYAFLHKPTGATTFQACGGVVHGNETLTAINVDADGQPVGDPVIGTWISGDVLSVQQAINGTHPDTGATIIVTEQLTHRFTATDVTVTHTHTWNVADSVGWFYSAMWPLVHWGVPAINSFKYAFDNLFTPQGGKQLATSYYGQANPIVGRTRDFYMQASGGVLQPAGSAGVASSVAPVYTAVAGLYVPPESVLEFSKAGSLFAGMAMNISGTTPPGFSSDVMKMYFERVPDSAPVPVAIGEVWQSQAIYYLQLVPKYPFDPTL